MRTRLSVSTLLWILLAASCFYNCNKVYNGDQLSLKTSQRLQRLGLLNADEQIYQFYSNAPNEAASAGNFYTSERIAQYWLDDDKRKTQLNFAYYQDIARIDITYLDKALTYVSYMVVTRRDVSQFRVYVGGKKPAVSAFFEHAIAHWKANACSSD